ncbi:hypothetical protein HMPREF1978_00912, partial [Actinomyces graevenitzii F0530]
MKMKYINRTIYLFLVLSLCLHTSTAIATDFSGNGDGTVWVVRGQENSTAPGGFSAVAEPAGPIDPEAAKRAAEEYAQKCIEPKILAIASMGLIPGPPEECAAQVNTGAPLAAGPTTVSNEQVARLIPHGSGINRYPSGEIFVIFKQPMMV